MRDLFKLLLFFFSSCKIQQQQPEKLLFERFKVYLFSSFLWFFFWLGFNQFVSFLLFFDKIYIYIRFLYIYIYKIFWGKPNVKKKGGCLFSSLKKERQIITYKVSFYLVIVSKYAGICLEIYFKIRLKSRETILWLVFITSEVNSSLNHKRI